MTYRGRIFYNALTCAWGGFIAWLILKVIFRFDFSPYYLASIKGGMTGLVIGALIGGLNGTTTHFTFRTIKGALVSLVVCLFGGAFSLLAGEFLYQIAFQFFLYHIFGWALFGLFIGISGGLFEGSPRRALTGSLGGAIGGLIGGLLYESFLFIFSARVSTGESIGIVLLSASIGASIGIFHLLLKRNWLTVVAGNSPGAQYPVEKKTIKIGKDASNDIIIDSETVSNRHAEIREEEGKYILFDLQSDNGTFVNDRQIEENMLKNGFQVKIGDAVEFLFEQKA